MEGYMKEAIVLFYTFAKIGILGFGGGQAMIPLIQVEVVDNYKWLSIEEFTEALAMANSLPGPITPKMSFFTGYKVAGMAGAGSCILGLVLPSLFLMFILTSLYMKYKDLPSVKGLLKAVKPVVVALLALVIYNISPSSVNSWHTALIAIISFCLLAFLNIHPALLILGAAMLGVTFYR